MGKTSLIFIGIVACLVSIASATPGIATFYKSYVPSACFGNKPQGNMIAAAGDALWKNGKNCGKTFTVKCTGSPNAVPNPCTGKNVTVKIVDHCPGPGCKSTLDLSQEAFAIIANPVAGIINIDYKKIKVGNAKDEV
ncbi:EG45-like domain containing protein [Hibiscus syriacus]|uniref:EG45-like domain containing protein n=1 Tax=Hibiscus syriacus TaxID=106335 RepID=A0A6A3BHQ5_HIBSY|nr:putative EG45-like domain containing protein 1 [Hibiscus syriacus]KAE8714978.1 EG45-like domain containing protein [Hibiscus syriacus]